MIKFGMSLAQIFNQLVKGYQRFTGLEPKGLDLIKIKQEAMKRFKDMNKVVDMEGTPIDTSKGIMGGKQIKDVEDAGEGFIEFVRKTDPKGAAKLQKEEDRIRAMIEAANKRAAKNLKDKKKKLDDPEDMAQGGRAGFKIGSIDKARRAFLKTVGAAGAGITALKTGMLGLTKGAAPAVEKAVETVTEAPSYFFDLVAKIKLFGKQKTTPSYKERVNEFTYTGKNGDQYELIEDMDTGEIMIQKDKMGVGVSGDKTFDTITDRTELRYKKPKPDEGDPNPTAEYEEYKVEFDADGTAADATEIDNLSKKEIIEEATKEAPSIKKAGGGIARMLGE